MFGATFVIFNYYDKELETVYFDTLSGELIVNRKRSLWDGFPKYELTEVDIRREMIDAIGCEPKKLLWDVIYGVALRLGLHFQSHMAIFIYILH